MTKLVCNFCGYRTSANLETQSIKDLGKCSYCGKKSWLVWK